MTEAGSAEHPLGLLDHEASLRDRCIDAEDVEAAPDERKLFGHDGAADSRGKLRIRDQPVDRPEKLRDLLGRGRHRLRH